MGHRDELEALRVKAAALEEEPDALAQALEAADAHIQELEAALGPPRAGARDAQRAQTVAARGLRERTRTLIANWQATTAPGSAGAPARPAASNDGDARPLHDAPAITLDDAERGTGSPRKRA